MSVSKDTPRVPRRPQPRPEGIDAEFYEKLKETGRLHFQRCLECHEWRHMPRYLCPKCTSPEWEWAPSSGRGALRTWTVTRRALHPAFADEVPFVVGIVELGEGVRMVSRIEGCPLDELRLNLPVELFLQETAEGLKLPCFRPAPS